MEKLMTSTDWTKVAEVELVYRSKVKASERPAIKTSSDAYLLLNNHWDENSIELVEHFKVLFLNNACKVLGIYHVSSGGMTGVVTDPKLIFSAALKAAASGIILAHNHPSGNLNPSEADKQLTAKMKAAGQFLDIRVIDHLILSTENYYSFADEGLL